jgi:hypothetical protein
MRHLFEPRCEIAYCMGLIVGEGSFTGDRTNPWLAVKLHARDPQPLQTLRGVFGGVIYGPYVHNGRHAIVWYLRGWQLVEALPYFDRWLPPSHKRVQYEAWLLRYAKAFARNPMFHDLRGVTDVSKGETTRLAGRFPAWQTGWPAGFRSHDSSALWRARRIVAAESACRASTPQWERAWTNPRPLDRLRRGIDKQSFVVLKAQYGPSPKGTKIFEVTSIQLDPTFGSDTFSYTPPATARVFPGPAAMKMALQPEPPPDQQAAVASQINKSQIVHKARRANRQAGRALIYWAPVRPLRPPV